MKKLSKTLLSVAAVSAVSAAMAASAMAMTASYEDGTVTLSDVASNGASQTLLIFKGDANTSVTSDNANEIVKQIDQADGTEDAPGDIGTSVVVGTLDDGTYQVRVSGTDGQMQEAEFTVGDVPTETTIIKIGDATLDNRISAGDASAISKYLIEIEDEDTVNVNDTYNVVEGVDAETIKIGDATLDNRISAGDASAVSKYLIEIEDEDTANVGNEVTVVAK